MFTTNPKTIPFIIGGAVVVGGYAFYKKLGNNKILTYAVLGAVAGFAIAYFMTPAPVVAAAAAPSVIPAGTQAQSNASAPTVVAGQTGTQTGS